MDKFFDGKIVAMTPEEEAEFEATRWVPQVQLEDYQRAVQALVDETARAKQFNDGVTLASYWNSTDPEWAAQAQVFTAWRDGVWKYCNAELAKVMAGERQQPTVEAFLLELPAIVWPA